MPPVARAYVVVAGQLGSGSEKAGREELVPTFYYADWPPLNNAINGALTK
jgi:hypothetical protein